MNASENVTVPGAGAVPAEQKHKGANGILEGYERRFKLDRNHPDFRALVEDDLANKSEEEANAIKMMIGYTPLPPTPRIPLDPDIVPDWIKRED